MVGPGSFAQIVSVDEVQRRLGVAFPEAFPDRAVLVGRMAARVVFVFLYGGFIEGAQRYLRPSVIYFFTAQQARKTSDEERRAWCDNAFKPKFRPAGDRWYADTSRESIRDDLIRNRLSRMGLVGRKPGVPTNSSKSTYFLRSAFARLFVPNLHGPALREAIRSWRSENLSPDALARMKLKAQGALAREGDVTVDLPDGSRMRLSAGPSATLVKALIESYAPRWLEQPAVLWVSASDEQTYPQFVKLASSVGLRFDPKELLPDLILADLGKELRFVFCEVVASDGPIDSGRKAALLAIASRSGVAADRVRFVSAYLDREAPALRKTFHRIAQDSDIWFTNEPDLLVRLTLRST